MHSQPNKSSQDRIELILGSLGLLFVLVAAGGFGAVSMLALWLGACVAAGLGYKWLETKIRERR